MQPHGVLIRHDAIGVAVDREDRRETGADVGQRRYAFGDLFAIRQAAEPRHRGIGAIGTLDHIVDIGNAEPVDRRRRLRHCRRAGALAIHAGALGNHRAGQRQMSASGFTGHNDSIDIDHVGLRLSGEIAQGAEAIFDCRRCRRDAREAVLDVDDVPPHLHPRKDLRHRAFLVARGPEASVEVHHRRLRRCRATPVVDIQLRLVVAGSQIGEIRRSLVSGIGMRRPGRGWGELRGYARRDRGEGQQQNKK